MKFKEHVRFLEDFFVCYINQHPEIPHANKGYVTFDEVTEHLKKKNAFKQRVIRGETSMYSKEMADDQKTAFKGKILDLRMKGDI